MDLQRIKILETTEAKLTQEELKQGWHFCPDWDYMLINIYTNPEREGCTCKRLRMENKA